MDLPADSSLPDAAEFAGSGPYLSMLCGAFAFACMGAIAHSLRDDCDWQVIALARAIVPLVVSLCMALAAGVRLVFWKPASLWLRSVCGSVSMVCTFYAFTRLQISEVLTLSNLFPIWVALLSWPVLRIAPTRDVWVATAAGVCGVWLIQQPHFEEQNQIAALAPLAGSLFSALAMLGLHRLQEIDARAIVVHFSFVTLAFAIAAFFVFERSVSPGAALDGKLLATLAVMGVAATVGQFFLTKAFTTGHPAKVSVVGLTQVGIGMAFDVLIWHRSFRAPTLLGVVLVVAPTAWLLWRRR